MQKKETTVAFTGYRTSKMFSGKTDTTLLNVVATETYLAIKECYKQGYKTYLTGMCDGFDLIAAEAVLKLKEQHSDIQLIAVVPFMGQELGYSQKDKEWYNTIYKLADEVVFTSNTYHKNAYLHRNDYLLEHSSMIICYYDGQRGGTMYTFNRAVKAGMSRVNIYTHLIDYFNNCSAAKKALSHYHTIDGFRFCKKGLIFDYTADSPLIIPFENIDKTENIAGRLHITLNNGQHFEVSLISDDCQIRLAPPTEPTIKETVSYYIDKVKEMF